MHVYATVELPVGEIPLFRRHTAAVFKTFKVPRTLGVSSDLRDKARIYGPKEWLRTGINNTGRNAR